MNDDGGYGGVNDGQFSQKMCLRLGNVYIDVCLMLFSTNQTNKYNEGIKKKYLDHHHHYQVVSLFCFRTKKNWI